MEAPKYMFFINRTMREYINNNKKDCYRSKMYEKIN